MSPNLVSDLQRDEGCRLHAYPDPLSGGEPWTVGFGATGPGIGSTTVWTQQQALDELIDRADALDSELANALPWFRTINDERQSALINMAYNLGLHGLLAFHNTLTLIEEGKYGAAATAMLDSAWAKQVSNRAIRLSRQMATGIHQT